MEKEGWGLLIAKVHQRTAVYARLDADVQDWLEQILRQIGEKLETTRSLPLNGHVPEVVLEVRVNGVLYALTRSCPCFRLLEVSLSPREQEIARLVTQGMPNKTIAALLEISQWTVATHLKRVYTKLGVNSRAEMVACVLCHHLLADHQ